MNIKKGVFWLLEFVARWLLFIISKTAGFLIMVFQFFFGHSKEKDEGNDDLSYNDGFYDEDDPWGKKNSIMLNLALDPPTYPEMILLLIAIAIVGAYSTSCNTLVQLLKMF